MIFPKRSSVLLADNASTSKVKDSPNVEDFTNDDDEGEEPIQLSQEDPVK